jgi:hypothetical protein
MMQAICVKTGKEYAIKAISKLQPEFNERVVQREVWLYCSRQSMHGVCCSEKLICS